MDKNPSVTKAQQLRTVQVQVTYMYGHAFTICTCGEPLRLIQGIFPDITYKGHCQKCRKEFRLKSGKIWEE